MNKYFYLILLLFSTLFRAESQCNVSSFTLSKTNATCLSNGEISVTVPNSLNCTNWVAVLQKVGTSTFSQLSIPQNGGTVLFNSLTSGNYNVQLTDGFSVINYAANPIVITSSYVNMNVSITSTPPSCPNNSQVTPSDGTLTINIANGTGVGPFVYLVSTPLGIQSISSNNRTHTFTGIPGGVSAAVSVTDQVNSISGCSITINQTHSTAQNTSQSLSFTDRPFNYERDCSSPFLSCNNVRLFVNLRNLTGIRLATIQQPGNAIISIGGINYNLTYVSGAARFKYDPILAGGPQLTNGMTVTTTFNDGCTTISKTSTVSMDNNFLLAQLGTETDPLNCSLKYRVKILADRDVSGGNGYIDRAVYFCQNNQLLFQKRISTAPDVWVTVPGTDITPNPYVISNPLSVNLGVTIPSAASTYYLYQNGVYRITASDSCHTATTVFTINDDNPFDLISAQQVTSVLEGTSAIKLNFNGLPPLTNPLSVKVTRLDGQTSLTINPTEPADLAGTYTINFPIIRTIPYPTTFYFIQDLPLGQYVVELSDGCSSTSGFQKTFNLNLTNPVDYNFQINVIQGCVGSNSIQYNLNPSNTPNSNLIVKLHKNINGNIGPFVQNSSSGNLSGNFTNLNSGNYFAVFSNVKAEANYNGNLSYSAAIKTMGPWQYKIPVLIQDYQNFDINVTTTLCDLSNSNSGIIDVQLVSGTISYPFHFSLYNSTNLTNPIQGPFSINSPSIGHVFTNVPTGNYVLVVENSCYSLSYNVQLTSSSVVPSAQVLNSFVCPNSPTTVGIIATSPSLFTINWYDSNNQLVANGTPVVLQPSSTMIYTAKYSLNSNLGCSNNQEYSSNITINVTPNPDSLIAVSDINLCNNNSNEFEINNSQINFDYELLNSNKQSLSPPYILAGTGFPLTFTIPSSITLALGDVFYVSSTNGNEGCSAILEDSCLVFQSTTDSTLTVNGDAICLGEDGNIEIENSEVGVNYTVFKNNQPVSPVLSAFGDGNAINFTIPSSMLVGGLNSFTIQATDTGCANVFLAQKGIIAVDTVNPVFFSCPSNIQVFVANGTCANTVTWSVPIVTDNCLLDTVYSSHQPGDLFPLGTTNVSYVAIDKLGNSDTCSFTVTVNDNIAPEFSNCPSDTLIIIPQNVNGVNVIWSNPIASDNCSVDSIFQSNFSNDYFATGTSVVNYYVLDQSGNSDTCSFTITITQNDSPLALNDSISINEDMQAMIAVLNNDNDLIGGIDTASVSIILNPSNGTAIVGINGQISYTPSLNFNGTDSLVYSICDLASPTYCDTAVVYIKVLPLNDAPVVDNELITTNEDTAVTGDLTDAGDFDPDGTTLTANTTPVDGPNHGTIVINANGTYTYTPSANFNGTDTVVVSICDSGLPMPAICVNDTIFITVNAINDAPIVDNEIITTNEDTAVTGDLTDAGDFDPDGTTLTANTTPVDGPNHGGIVINTDGTYTYTPATNFNGTDTVVVSICDSGLPLPAICVNDTIFITVNAINDAPIVDNEIITTNEDTAVTGDLTDAGDFDPDGTTLTANTTPVDGPNYGTIVINANGTYTYTPSANFNGTDTVVVAICDSGLPMPAICVNDTIFITVNPINDAPIVDNEIITTNEDTAVTGDLTDAGDFDPDGTIVTANTTPVDGPNHGTIVINANGTYTYTPATNFNGTDTVVVSICDSGLPMPAICVNDTIFITVNPINDTIVAVNDTIQINSGETVVIGIIGNDFDIDGNLDLSSISIVSDPTQGEFTLNNTTGEITYIPNANACGVDSLVYSICDDGTPLPAACDLATVYIQIIDTINPVIISTLSDTLRACEGVAFSWDEPIALDNCTLTSFTCSATNNSYFEVGTTEVNYTAIDAVGNTTIMSFIIIVSPKPEVFIEKSTYEFCNGTDVTIFSQVSDSSLQFNWEFNNTMISTDREIVINNISAYNVGFYTLTVQDEFGCKATDNAFLQVVNCDIVIPEGVSPNSDGKNDVFFIENLEGYPNTEVTFFNRWGMQIYQSDDYKNDWDCHSTSRLNMNNEVLPEGTYYYLIKLGGDPESLSYGKIYKGYFYIKP